MIENVLKRLSLLTLFLYLFGWQTVAWAASGNWHLKQFSKVQGRQELWLSPQSMKIVNTNKGVTILINLREVWVWSDQEKLVCRVPLSNWRALHTVYRENAVSSEYGGIVKGPVQDGELMGLPTKKICWSSKKSVARGEPAPRAVLWASKSLGLPKEFCQAIQYYYALPVVDGFPLQCYRFSEVEGNDYRLKTLFIEHCADLSGRFKPPANYRSAKNEGQILYGNDKTDFIKTMTSD